MNIGNYTQQLTEYMTYKKYSPESVKNYSACISKFLSAFTDQATKPSEISTQKITTFLSGFKQVNTHKAYLCSLKLFYDKVCGQPNKLQNIEYPRSSKKLPIILSTAEIQALFNACENIKHRVILALLYSAGLRVSELLNLKWCHIDRSRMIINIIEGKGKKDRQVMLTPELIPLLENYYKQYKPIEFVLNGQFPKIDLRYSEKSVNQVLKQLADKAGIKKRIYAHLIRHCSFTHMVEAGTDINLIQRLAGHSNVKTTNIYLHISHNKISSIKSPLSAINI